MMKPDRLRVTEADGLLVSDNVAGLGRYSLGGEVPGKCIGTVTGTVIEGFSPGRSPPLTPPYKGGEKKMSRRHAISAMSLPFVRGGKEG